MPNNKNTHDVHRAQLIVAAVGLEFGTPQLDIASRQRGGSDVCLARQISMYLMNVIYGISLTRIGRVFNRDRSTASHACNVIEDYREDPLLNQKIEKLENFLYGATSLAH